MENWKSVLGYEGLYEVSDLGKVKGLERYCICKSKTRIVSEKIKNLRFDKYGYLRSSFSKLGIVSTIQVHRLVALAFISNPENKKTVNHKNGIKTDNRVENLEWNTTLENNLHSREHGLNKNSGQTHYKAKLTNKEVFDIKYNSNGISQKSLSKKYNVCHQTISQIKTGNIWKKI